MREKKGGWRHFDGTSECFSSIYISLYLENHRENQPKLYYISGKRNLHEKVILLNFCAPPKSLLHSTTKPKGSHSMAFFFLFSLPAKTLHTNMDTY